MGVLLAIADKSIEGRGIATFQKRDIADIFTLAGMGLGKLEEVTGHIPLALGQQVIPCHPLFLEHVKETIFLIDHLRAHDPGLHERKIILPQMGMLIGLIMVLDGDMHAPVAVAQSFRRGAGLAQQCLGVTNHGLCPDEVHTG